MKDKTKKHACPNCLPNGGAYFRLDYVPPPEDAPEGARWVHVWKCENCGHLLPARTQKRRERTEATPAQKEALEAFRAKVENLKSYGGDPAKYEWKKWEVSFVGDDLWLVAEYGSKGDEGTLAAIFCRDRYHVAIGRQGGVRPAYWSGPKAKEPRGVFAVANWGTEYKKPAEKPAATAEGK